MDKKTFLEGIAIGAVTATVATIMLATKSGKDTRKEIKSHLMEIKDKIIDQLEKAGDFPQKTYDEVVKAVVGEYKAAKKITGKEAKDIQAKLQGGYVTIKETVKRHAAAVEAAAEAAPKVATKVAAKIVAKPVAKVAAKVAKAAAKPAAKVVAKPAAKVAAKPAAKAAPARKAPAAKKPAAAKKPPARPARRAT